MVHHIMKKLFFALSLVFLTAALPAHAQNCNGQAGAGGICGNPGATTGFPSFTSLNLLLDRNFGTTQGRMLNRGASTWSATSSPVLGLPGTTDGIFGFASTGGGTATLSATSTASALVFKFPTIAGTLPSTASAPIVLNATTGVVSCPTCATSTLNGAALTSGDDTNVTLTLGGSPSNALLNAASITAGWTGQLSLTRGGTNASLTASNGGLVYSTATGFAILSGTATAGQIPRSGSSAAPSWSTATYPATTSAGTVLASASANTISGTATPTLGIPGSVLGTIAFAGNTSGTVTLTPQPAAGTPTLTLPTSSGTLASTATTPIVLNAVTGALTCPTCVTSSGGGAITGVPPIAVSSAGAVSITGQAGAVLAGSSPAFTSSPTLGVAGSTLGSVAFANLTSGSVTLQPQTGALGSSVVTIPAVTDTIAVLAASQAFTNKTYNGLTVTPTTGTLTVASGKTLTVSNTVTLSGTDGSTVAFGTGGTVVYAIGTGTAALGTSAISAGTCATVVTVAATGVATTDVVDASFNGDPTGVTGYIPGSMLSIVAYPTANNVNFKVCNNTGSSITPGAITLNWKVSR